MYYKVIQESNPYCSFPEFIYNVYLYDTSIERVIKVKSYDDNLTAQLACRKMNLGIRADLRHQS